MSKFLKLLHKDLDKESKGYKKELRSYLKELRGYIRNREIQLGKTMPFNLARKLFNPYLGELTKEEKDELKDWIKDWKKDGK